MNQPADVPPSERPAERQPEHEPVAGAGPEPSAAGSPGELPPELAELFPAMESPPVDQPAEPSLPTASAWEDEAAIPLDAPPPNSGSVTSASARPIRPANAWTAGAESFVGSPSSSAASPGNASPSAGGELPEAEEVPLAEDMDREAEGPVDAKAVAPAAVDLRAASQPPEGTEAPRPASPNVTPSAANAVGEPASAADRKSVV